MFAMNAVAPKGRQIAEPRFDHYEDTGCEVASTCFDCPLTPAASSTTWNGSTNTVAWGVICTYGFGDT